jgi:hypothetical protein
LNKSWFLQEEHTRLGQEAAAQPRVVELTHELGAAQVSVLHECGHTAAAEQELFTSRSALGVEQAALGVERATRALAEGQAPSRGQRITELEVTLCQSDEGLMILEAAATGEWFSPSFRFCFAFCGL